MSDNGEENDNENDLKYSKELYKETSKRLDKAYIILITFILFFFFGLFIPYTFLEHRIESNLNDRIIGNLSELSRLTVTQENISKSIQNKIDELTVSAAADYKKLDEYYRKVELLESKAFLTSNLSADELEAISPTFLTCNHQFRSNISNWASCNAKFVADGINNRTMLRFDELPQQVNPLVTKAQNNLKTVYQIATALNDTNKTSSRLPIEIEPKQWKDVQKKISTAVGQAAQLEKNNERVGEFLRKSNESVVWKILSVPPGSEIAYNENIQREIDKAVNSLNQTKNELRQELKDLSSKFEEIEFPVIGKIPVSLANAVIAFPSAIGVGALICSYYLGQTISKRLVFHRIFNKANPELQFNGELYPVWIDPLERKLFRYGRLVLFFSLPLVILFLISDLSFLDHTNRGYIAGSSFLDLSEDSVLVAGVIIGLILIGLGVFIILKESHEYSSYLNDIKKIKQTGKN